MSFVQAKCENCGGILNVDSSLKAAICPFCGIAYVVQDSINYYNSTTKVEHMHADVVNVSDESSSEGRLKAADAYMKLGKYDKAETEYKKVTELTPQNYLGWLGLIEAYTHQYSRRIITREEVKQLNDYAKSVGMFAPSGQKDEILSKYNGYIKSEEAKDKERTVALNHSVENLKQRYENLKEQEMSLEDNLSTLDKSEKLVAVKVRNMNANKQTIENLFLALGIVGVIVGLIFMIVNVLVGIIMAICSLGFFALLILKKIKDKNLQNVHTQYLRDQTHLRFQISEIRQQIDAINKEIKTYNAEAERLQKKY